MSYPGSAYTLSLGSGNWAFTTDGTGYHVIDTSGNRVKMCIRDKHQGTDLFADSDANRYDRGLGINGSGDDKGSYQIIQRYNADGSLRANQGQVIIAHTAADMSAGIPEAFATIPVDNAMDSSVDSATIYHWTDPQSQKGGDVGEIAAALRTISGYAWCDNGYNDGTYTYTPGKYYDCLLYTSEPAGYG